MRRVKSKDNVLADPVSRLATSTFKDEARKLGATKFVQLPMAPEVRQLFDDLATRLGELEADSEPTSGTAKTEAEVYAREERYVRMKKEATYLGRDPDDPAGATPRRWGFMSGFCGANSMPMAARDLGGVPVAGFDIDELVQRIWTDRTGVQCWGEFADVTEAAHDGLLDGLRDSLLVYISGSPCPDYSTAGAGSGLLGTTGGLWLDDCELGIRLRPPIIIREMVTGIFAVDNGAPFWAAVDRYRDAGYAVAWSVRMARRHGDATSRRRVFLVAILPECLREGMTTPDFFKAEGAVREKSRAVDFSQHWRSLPSGKLMSSFLNSQNMWILLCQQDRMQLQFRFLPRNCCYAQNLARSRGLRFRLLARFVALPLSWVLTSKSS